MTQPEKLRVAKALAELGVDVIEAGFPIASRGDWESVNLIAREVHGPIIAGLARCNREDIEQAWRRCGIAARPRIHVFLATSAIHREYKLNMAKDEIIRTAVEGVKFARELVRRRRVLAGGRLAHRARVPRSSRRGRHRCGRNDDQRSRHRRLHGRRRSSTKSSPT